MNIVHNISRNITVKYLKREQKKVIRRMDYINSQLKYNDCYIYSDKQIDKMRKEVEKLEIRADALATFVLFITLDMSDVVN